jgi:hypothetical protein
LASILIMSVAVVLAGQCRADDQEPKAQGPAQTAAQELPPAVLEAAYYHVPDLTVDDVSLRQVKGHPTVYVIDGQCCDRSVVLAIEENGDVHEIRFHKYNGVKPEKIVQSPEDLPALVRETADRVIPDMEIVDVRSSQAEGEQRIYHVIGTVIQDGMERHVTLTVEEDGDLLEARVIKPIKDVAAVDDAPAVPSRDPNDD